MIQSRKIWTLRDSIRKTLPDAPRSSALRKISIEAFSMPTKSRARVRNPADALSPAGVAGRLPRLSAAGRREHVWASALRGLSAFGLDPGKRELWLRSGSSAEEFALAAVPVPETRKNLDELITEGFMIYSADEKMGIQVIERKILRSAAPAAEGGGKGRLASYDPVYARHGATGVIASMSLGGGSAQ
jgi:hypothetical protein